MDLVVDLAAGCVAVDGWDTLTSLSVQIARPPESPSSRADEESLTATLAGAGIGRSAPTGDALVPTEVLRRLAVSAAGDSGLQLDAGWEQEFADMVARAGANGWIDDDGAIRAHVEWRDF